MSNTLCFKYIWNYKDFDATLLAISYILAFAVWKKKKRSISIIQDVLYWPSTVLEQGDYQGSFIGSKNFGSQVMALYLKVKKTISTIH